MKHFLGFFAKKKIRTVRETGRFFFGIFQSFLFFETRYCFNHILVLAKAQTREWMRHLQQSQSPLRLVPSGKQEGSSSSSLLAV